LVEVEKSGGPESYVGDGVTATRYLLSVWLPALIIGAGGSGVLAVTHVDALHLARFGGVRPGTKFLGFDVMPSPPVVTVRRQGDAPLTEETLSVRLEPGVEYCRIGQGCDPRRLAGIVRADGALAPELRHLLERQPGQRFTKSLENGTEGERLFGLLAFVWSLPEIRRRLRDALRQLNDLRLPGGHVAASRSILVAIVNSVVGGVGSAVALLLCREVKRAMDDLGMDVPGSLFIAICFTPDAFQPSTLRHSNTYDTLQDYSVAQREAMLP
jgi:hypothetical protein